MKRGGAAAGERNCHIGDTHLTVTRRLERVCSAGQEICEYLTADRTITGAGEVKCGKFSIFPSWEAFEIPMGTSETHLHLGWVSVVFPQRYFANQFGYH